MSKLVWGKTTPAGIPARCWVTGAPGTGQVVLPDGESIEASNLVSLAVAGDVGVMLSVVERDGRKKAIVIAADCPP